MEPDCIRVQRFEGFPVRKRCALQGRRRKEEEGKDDFSLGLSDGEQRLASHRDVTEIEFTKLALGLKVKVERTSGNGSEA